VRNTSRIPSPRNESKKTSWFLFAQAASRGANLWGYANSATGGGFLLKTKLWHEFKSLNRWKLGATREGKLVGMRDRAQKSAQTGVLNAIFGLRKTLRSVRTT
jgi:hypothetical protein